MPIFEAERGSKFEIVLQTYFIVITNEGSQSFIPANFCSHNGNYFICSDFHLGVSFLLCG